jgi:inner membrane protein
VFESSLSQPTAPRRRSIGVRVVILALLALLFGVPLLVVRSIVDDRRALREEALNGIRQSWGGAQTIVGPILALEETCTLRAQDGTPRSLSRTFWKLPGRYEVHAQVDAQPRQRGLHETVVLLADVALNGTFPAGPSDFGGVACDDVRLDRASLQIALTDSRALASIEELQWNGTKLAWQPGVGFAHGWLSGLRADLPLELAQRSSRESGTFAVRLRVRASDELLFTPLGDPTRVEVTSRWPNPSYRGAYLPTQHDLTAEGFRATWEIPALGRRFAEPTSGGLGGEFGGELRGSEFGAAWLVPADSYLSTDRALKYGLLFVGATFATLFFFELFARRALHPMHYLLVGVAITVFYLLLLSLSERAGFDVAYALATLGTTLLVTGYAAAILGGWLRGLGLGGTLAAFYVALYSLLRAEEHALIVGSIGLFVSLAVLMWLTRNVDWSNPRLGAERGAVDEATRAASL